MTLAITTLTLLTLIALWAPPLFGFSYRELFTQWRELRRHKRQHKAQMALIEECFQESQEWEERRAERERRFREREDRRAA